MRMTRKRNGWKRTCGMTPPLYRFYRNNVAVGGVWRGALWHWCVYDSAKEGGEHRLRDAKAALVAALESTNG
jgi:hypothetical protein